MNRWLRGPRAVVLMVTLWTFGWGLGYGGFIEAAIDPHGRIEDVWLTVMAVPGFIGGTVFATLLQFAEDRTRFDQVPLTRMVVWGVVTGVVLGLLGVAMDLAGELLSPSGLAMLGAGVGLSLVAALVSALCFRWFARKQQRNSTAGLVSGPGSSTGSGRPKV